MCVCVCVCVCVYVCGVITLNFYSLIPSQDCSSMPFAQSGIPSHRSDLAMHLSSLMHKNIPSKQFTTRYMNGERKGNNMDYK